jgi:hypothetical protein
MTRAPFERRSSLSPASVRIPELICFDAETKAVARRDSTPRSGYGGMSQAGLLCTIRGTTASVYVECAEQNRHFDSVADTPAPREQKRGANPQAPEISNAVIDIDLDHAGGRDQG